LRLAGGGTFGVAPWPGGDRRKIETNSVFLKLNTLHAQSPLENNDLSPKAMKYRVATHVSTVDATNAAF
jgi:hypothetical protein